MGASQKRVSSASNTLSNTVNAESLNVFRTVVEEGILPAYKGSAPMVDPAEAAQRGLIEAWLKNATYTLDGEVHDKGHEGEDIDTGDAIRAACGWKTTLKGRPNREFGACRHLQWEGAKYSISSPAQTDVIELQSLESAAAPGEDWGDCEEAIAKLAESLEPKQAERLRKLLEAPHKVGGNTRKALRKAVAAALPEWRESMQEVLASREQEAEERMAAYEERLEGRREIWIERLGEER